jgi:HlyD family secretion protein
VADTYFRVGEWVRRASPWWRCCRRRQPGALLRARGELGSIAVGAGRRACCDGCGAPIPARIDFIATQAEYTPPVIYSNSQRARLVFMVEARPRTEGRGALQARPAGRRAACA